MPLTYRGSVWDTVAAMNSESSAETSNMADGKNVLSSELATYDREKAGLVSESEGKYVVIKGDDVLGVYSSQDDAIAAGYQKYGNVPFLVKQILLIETPINFASNTLGLADADIQCAGH